jgi:hypothetical protein
MTVDPVFEIARVKFALSIDNDRSSDLSEPNSAIFVMEIENSVGFCSTLTVIVGAVKL